MVNTYWVLCTVKVKKANKHIQQKNFGRFLNHFLPLNMSSDSLVILPFFMFLSSLYNLENRRCRGSCFIYWFDFIFVLFHSGPKVIDSSKEQMRNQRSSTRSVVTWPKRRGLLMKNAYTENGREKFRLHSSKCIKDRDRVQRTRHFSFFAVASHLVISLLASLTKEETPVSGC